MNDLTTAIVAGFNSKIYKIIVSKPRLKTNNYKKIVISQINNAYHLEKYTTTQVFNENLSPAQLQTFLCQALEKEFQQYNAWDDQFEYIIQISKKGKPSATRKALKEAPAKVQNHNRKKNYLLPEGVVIPPLVDMGIITLHACDTATDYALYNAIKWNAKLIFSVPCCQHELNSQMETAALSLLTKYGIVKERTAALITDAIRGSLLEACGYKVQLLEFVDLAHTPKNILIRAKKTKVTATKKAQALAEVENAIQAFSLKPTLFQLLETDNLLNSNKI